MTIKEIPTPTLPDWTKLLNSYDPDHYTPGKRVSAEEWNTLFLACVNQGNYNSDTLELLIYNYLPETFLTQVDFKSFSTAIQTDFEQVKQTVTEFTERVEKAESVAYGINDVVQEANTYAKQAYTYAEAANNTASTAQDVATTANQTAENANSTANEALQVSEKAKQNADTALEQSTQAVSTANTAKLRSEDAIATANAAKVSATSAETTAQTAETNSRTAIETAENANTVSADAHSTAEEALKKVVEGRGTTVTVAGEVQSTFNADIKADVEYVNERVAALVGAAPETLDTLEEVATAIAENEDVVSALNTAIGTKLTTNIFNTYVANNDACSDSDGNFGQCSNIYKNDGQFYASRKFLFNKDDFTQDGEDTDKLYSLSSDVTRTYTPAVVFAESERQKSKNLFDKAAVLKGFEISGTNLIANSSYFVSDYCYVKGLTSVYLSGKTRGITNLFYDENLRYISLIPKVFGQIDVPTGAVYMRFNAPLTVLDDNIMLEAGTEATEYQPYSGQIVHEKQLNSKVSNYLPLSGGKMRGNITCIGFKWSEKIWNGLTIFYGNRIWNDGENIYYSYGTSQYVLDKKTSICSEKIWYGLTIFNGTYIWSDGENIYYSDGTSQYVLDKETSTWSKKIWNGFTSFYGNRIWNDGENIYYSYGASQYVLDKETSTWSEKTWNGLTIFNGTYIWSDGENIYYGDGSDQYVLDKETSTWSEKTWNGLTGVYGECIWSDGENIYYSDGSDQYVLDKETSTWSEKTWNGLTIFNGLYIWSDGENIYYSAGSDQYVLDDVTTTFLTDQTLIDITYPIGTIYMSVANNSPASFIGGTWEQLSEGYALWTASSGAGSTIRAGLPNIAGHDVIQLLNSETSYNPSGCFYHTLIGKTSDVGTSGTNYMSYYNLKFLASTGEMKMNGDIQNDVYGWSNTVQPPAYKVYAWKRIS